MLAIAGGRGRGIVNVLVSLTLISSHAAAARRRIQQQQQRSREKTTDQQNVNKVRRIHYRLCRHLYIFTALPGFLSRIIYSKANSQTLFGHK